MPVKNIECQLAQGQIGRYINGDLISAEAVKQLEAHVLECEDCKDVVATRKRAIMNMLGETTPTMALVETDRGATLAPDKLSRHEQAIAAFTLRAKAQTPAEVQSEAPPKSNPPRPERILNKPILYCCGLALVLLAMSYLSRGALQFFGPTSNDLLAKSPIPASTRPLPTAPITAPTPNLGTAAPDSSASGRPEITPAPARPLPPLKKALAPTPKAHPLLKHPALNPAQKRLSKPVIAQHHATPPSVRVRRSRAPLHRSHRPRALRISKKPRHRRFASVRVYDAQGRLIK